jgi:hypothetical protein
MGKTPETYSRILTPYAYCALRARFYVSHNNFLVATQKFSCTGLAVSSADETSLRLHKNRENLPQGRFSGVFVTLRGISQELVLLPSQQNFSRAYSTRPVLLNGYPALAFDSPYGLQKYNRPRSFLGLVIFVSPEGFEWNTIENLVLKW